MEQNSLFGTGRAGARDDDPQQREAGTETVEEYHGEEQPALLYGGGQPLQ